MFKKKDDDESPEFTVEESLRAILNWAESEMTIDPDPFERLLRKEQEEEEFELEDTLLINKTLKRNRIDVKFWKDHGPFAKDEDDDE